LLLKNSESVTENIARWRP